MLCISRKSFKISRENIIELEIECNIWHSMLLNTAKFTHEIPKRSWKSYKKKSCWLLRLFLLACSIKLNENEILVMYYTVEYRKCRATWARICQIKMKIVDVKHHNNLTNWWTTAGKLCKFTVWRDLFIHSQNQLRRRRGEVKKICYKVLLSVRMLTYIVFILFLFLPLSNSSWCCRSQTTTFFNLNRLACIHLVLLALY